MKFEDFNIPKGLGYGKNYYSPLPVKSYNEYWDVTTKRTYKELEDYFRPDDYYNPYGYYSTYYQEKFYDGYGYNFYYGNTGYYEYSRPPVTPVMIKFDIVEFIYVFGYLMAIIIVYALITYFFWWKQNNKEKKQ